MRWFFGFSLLLAVVAGATTLVLGEEVVFVDPDLAAAVRDELGLPADHVVTAEDMLALTKVWGAEGEISDLTGLEHAVNLEQLYLDGHPVSDLTPLAGLHSILEIHLWNNQITNFDALAGLQGIYELDLRGNPISDASPAATMPNLRWLDLSRSLVTDLSPLAGMTNLRSLILNGNGLSDLTPLSGMTGLRGLGLSLNAITDLSPLAGLQLIEVSFTGNQIEDLSPLAGMTEMEELSLENNLIRDLSPLAGMNRLRGLNVQRNYLWLWPGSEDQVFLDGMNEATSIMAGYQKEDLTDSDEDGIRDDRETRVFGNLDTSDAESDFDGDGYHDAVEFRIETDVTNAADAPRLGFGREPIDEWFSPAVFYLEGNPGRGFWIVEWTHHPGAEAWTRFGDPLWNEFDSGYVIIPSLATVPFVDNAGDPTPVFFRLRAVRSLDDDSTGAG